jgi:DNA-binding PadR family transcriptional regulator
MYSAAMRGDVLRGHLELLLLACLENGAAHGYLVMERLKERSRGAFDLPEGTIYPLLRRLEQRSYVTSRWVTVSGRKRRVYKLTAAGRRQVAQGRQEWAGFTSAVQSVLSGGA